MEYSTRIGMVARYLLINIRFSTRKSQFKTYNAIRYYVDIRKLMSELNDLCLVVINWLYGNERKLVDVMSEDPSSRRVESIHSTR